MSNDSIGKTIVVALAICAVWSLLVSTAAVTLKPIQEQNKRIEKMRNILDVGNLLQPKINVETVFNRQIVSRIVDLSSGKFLPETKQVGLLKPENYDLKQVAKDTDLGKSIPADLDKAGIRRMPKFVQVYFVREGDSVTRIILPVYGSGLWSTMYGLIALDQDLRTIRGFTFYEQGETPGLGGEVDNPAWKAQWNGKLAFDESGNLKIEVIKGKVDTSKIQAKYQIDGLSGSTLTTNGVNNLVRFWLGDQGFGRFLQNLRQGGVDGEIH